MVMMIGRMDSPKVREEYIYSSTAKIEHHSSIDRRRQNVVPQKSEFEERVGSLKSSALVLTISRPFSTLEYKAARGSFNYAWMYSLHNPYQSIACYHYSRGASEKKGSALSRDSSPQRCLRYGFKLCFFISTPSRFTNQSTTQSGTLQREGIDKTRALQNDLQITRASVSPVLRAYLYLI